MSAIREQALRFLARREHSRVELQRKLLDKGWDAVFVATVINELSAQQLQDDDRYTNAYIQARSSKGYGPRRIIAELATRGIHTIPADLADENSAEWFAALTRTWQKKFNELPRDLRTKAQQIRFLLYRGFSLEQINIFYSKSSPG